MWPWIEIVTEADGREWKRLESGPLAVCWCPGFGGSSWVLIVVLWKLFLTLHLVLGCHNTIFLQELVVVSNVIVILFCYILNNSKLGEFWMTVAKHPKCMYATLSRLGWLNPDRIEDYHQFIFALWQRVEKDEELRRIALSGYNEDRCSKKALVHNSILWTARAKSFHSLCFFWILARNTLKRMRI